MALIVKKSRLPNAGKGLFTTKAIPKNAKVIEYRGEIIGWGEYLKRVKANKDGYLFYLSRKHCIDAFDTPQYKARYANDAQGISRIKGVRNNCDYEIFGDKCYIVSRRAIKAGEEIYVNYTNEYWDSVRFNIREEKKKERAKLRKAEKQKKK